jgi:uncharacterized RmlC-like cupin family protein
MDIINRNQTEAFTTADGSTIRELLAHRNSSIRNQSLAEAVLAPGQSTAAHYHPRAEEIYYLLSGQGLMTIGDESREVTPVMPSPFLLLPPTPSSTPVQRTSSSSACAPQVMNTRTPS